jgi:hypothetical protein
MRASLYLFGFAAAAIVGAGVVEIGCSSSSSPPANNTPEDASMTDAPTAGDSGAPGDAAPTPCTPLDASAATIATGSPLWDCYEAMCAPSLTACAADCQCNTDVLTSLQCIAADAGTSTSCFTPVSASTASTDMAVLTCLVANAACMSATGEGGTPEAGTPDGGTPEAGADAGDGG